MAERADGTSAPEGATILDPTTGTYSIEYFEHQMRSEVAYAVRHGMRLSLILFTIDHHEELLGAFGAEVRDRVLHRVSDEVRELIREEDVFARYGVAEFAILCRGTERNAAGFLAKRIRQTIESTAMSYGGVELPVTVSLGVSSLLTNKDEHTSVVEGAERALQKARQGGNCIVLHE